MKNKKSCEQNVFQRYAPEIAVMRRRVLERMSSLSMKEKENLSYTSHPRNKAEEALFEDITAFIACRVHEGMKEEFAKEIADQIAESILQSLHPVKIEKKKNLRPFYILTWILIILLFLGGIAFLVWRIFFHS